MRIRDLFLYVALLALAGCDPAERESLPPGFSTQAVAFLDSLQPRSIAENTEYCGYFGLDAAERFTATDPIPGGIDYCDLDPSAPQFEVLASYHTHAAFDTESDSEVPSDIDLLSDMEEEVFGFIATPGGRVWLADWQDATVTQLCGVGCVYQDPDFIRGDAGPIAQSYTLRALQRRF